LLEAALLGAASHICVCAAIQDALRSGGHDVDVYDCCNPAQRVWEMLNGATVGLGGLRMSIEFEKLEERPLEFEKLEERPLEFASLRAKGTGVGALMNMTTSFTLSGEGERTSMAWEADVKIAGPVGSMGQRVLQPIVNQQVGQVLAALETRVASATPGRP
jgi:hypothetical protein